MRTIKLEITSNGPFEVTRMLNLLGAATSRMEPVNVTGNDTLHIEFRMDTDDILWGPNVKMTKS